MNSLNKRSRAKYDKFVLAGKYSRINQASINIFFKKANWCLLGVIWSQRTVNQDVVDKKLACILGIV